MLTTYLFIRRRCSAVAALFGLVVLSTSGIASYADLARPYALVLGFTGLALLSWQGATEDRRSRVLPLIGMAVGIAGAIASHHYGVFQVGLPLLAGEAVRLFRRRRIDLPVWLAGVVGLSAAATNLPFALETNRLMLVYTRGSTNFWAKPSLASLGDYAQMAMPRLVVLFVALSCLALLFLKPVPAAAPARDRLPAHEVAAAMALALLLPAMILVTWLATGYYGARYAIGTTMGVAILLAYVADRLGGRGQGVVAASLCMVLLVAGTAGLRSAAYVYGLVSPAKPEATLVFPPGDGPVVYCSSVDFLNDWQNAPATLRPRLRYLADLPYALTQPDFLAEVSLVVNQSVVPAKVDDYRAFLASHPRFLLYCGGDAKLDWVKDRLLAAGWTLRLLERAATGSLFSAQAPGSR